MFDGNWELEATEVGVGAAAIDVDGTSQVTCCSLTIDLFLVGLATARLRFGGTRVKPERVRRGVEEKDVLTFGFALARDCVTFTSAGSSLCSPGTPFFLFGSLSAMASAVGAAEVDEPEAVDGVVIVD